MKKSDRVFFVVVTRTPAHVIGDKVVEYVVGMDVDISTIAAHTWYAAREHARQLFGVRLVNVSAQVEGSDPADADIRVGGDEG